MARLNRQRARHPASSTLFPLEDTVKSTRRAVATWAFAAINVAVFVAEISATDRGAVLKRWALFPDRFDGTLAPAVLTTLLTSAFLHAGLVHLAANLTYLIVFGRTVEGRLGPAPFALLYLGGALASGLVYVLANPGSDTPVVGASGAVSAVLGAYLFYFPTARVHVAVPLLVFFVRSWIPALLFIAIWLATQVSGLLTPGSNVAWWGHLGGFGFGCFAGFMLAAAPARPARRRKKPS